MLAPSAPVAPKIFGPFDGPGALAYRRPMKRWLSGSAMALTLAFGPALPSVALADGYCGVYPRSSPGGWKT
mgnify:CR=1 FL=1